MAGPSINLAALQANAPALKAKGFNPPGYVEDLGGDTTPATPLEKAQDADAAAILGAAPAPQPFAEGMTKTGEEPGWNVPDLVPLPDGSYQVKFDGTAPPPPTPFGPPTPPPGTIPTPPVNTGWTQGGPAKGPEYTQADEDLLASLIAQRNADKAAGKDVSALEERIHNLALHRQEAPIAKGVVSKLGAPSGGGGGGGGGVAPHPLTTADKESAVWLPGQKEAFQNEKEFATLQQVWQDTITDKTLETERVVNDMNAKALDEQANALAKEKVDREEFESFMSTEQAKLQAESDKIANTKMDPSRLFKGENGWLSVTGAIAASIFGVMGAPATGGKNAGVDAVNSAINRDLALQEKDLENAKSGVARKSSLLAQKYALFGDKQRAMAAARIDAWKLAMAKADSYAAQTGNEIHALQAAKVREAGEREIARAQEKWDIDTEARWREMKARMDAERARAALSAQAKADKYTDKIMDVELGAAKAVAEAYGKEGKQVNVVVENNHVKVVDPTTGKQLWEGSGLDGGGPGGKSTVTVPGEMNAAGQWSSAGTAPAHSAEAQNKYNDVTIAAKKGLELVAKAREMRKKNNGGALIASSGDKADAAFIKRELFTSSKTAGENSDKDAERIEATIPDPLATDAWAAVMGGKPYTDAMLDNLEAKFKADIDRANKTYLKKPPSNPLPLTAPSPKGK